MKQDKKCKVIILPQKKKDYVQGDLILEVTGNLIIAGEDKEFGSWKAQHLYFVSKDEIKQGDIKLTEWYIHYTFGSKFLEQASSQDIENWKNGHSYGNKVLASTDPSLNLPLIGKEFLDLYVINNGNINEVTLKWIGPDCRLTIGTCKCFFDNNHNKCENYINGLCLNIVGEVTILSTDLKEEKIQPTFAIIGLSDEWNKETEEAAKNYEISIGRGSSNYLNFNKETEESTTDIKIAFKAGANWFKEQIKSDLAKSLNFIEQLDNLHSDTSFHSGYYKEKGEIIEKLKISLDKIRQLCINS